MSKRKKPDDEHREWCNRVLRVLAELPGLSGKSQIYDAKRQDAPSGRTRFSLEISRDRLAAIWALLINHRWAGDYTASGAVFFSSWTNSSNRLFKIRH